MPAPRQVTASVDWANAASQNLTLTGVLGGSSLILLCAADQIENSADPVLTATDGVAYTEAAHKLANGAHCTVGAYYRHGVLAGDYTVVISRAVGFVYGRLLFLEVPGLANSAPGTKGTNGGDPGNGSSQAISSGSTGVLAQPTNMVFYIAIDGVDPGPAGVVTPSGYNPLLLRQGSSATDPMVSMAWKDTSDTTAENPSSGTAATTYYWAATAIPFAFTPAPGLSTAQIIEMQRPRVQTRM